MRVLVTGATGFIGSHLVAALRARGDEVVCVVRRPVTSRDPAITLMPGDMSDLSTLHLTVERLGAVDAVFHLAAAMPDQSGFGFAEFLVANGAATARLLEMAHQLGARHFVYISSLSVLGEPHVLPITESHPLAPSSGYALGKLAGEFACEVVRRNGKLAASSLRIASPYGLGMPQNTVLSRFMNSAVRGEVLQWYGSGNRAQDFVHVGDVVAACLLAAATEHPGVYNIGSGRVITMRELAELIATAVPGATARPAGRPDAQEGVAWHIDIAAARAHLGYEPKVDLTDGIGGYLEHLRIGAGFVPWWTMTSSA